MQPTIKAATLRGLKSLLAEFAVSLDELLNALDLPIDIENASDHLLNLEQLTDILERSAYVTECPHLALLLTSRQSPEEVLGLINLLAKSAPNMQVAIGEMLQYLRLHASGIGWDLSHQDGLLISDLTVEGASFPSKQCVDIAVGQAFILLRSLTNNQWTPKVVHFHYQQPDDIWFYRQFFKCPIEFNSERNGFTSDAQKLLNITLNHYDEQMRQVLHQHVAQLDNKINLDFPTKVANEIRQAISCGEFNASNIASRLRCSERTLHRRLNKEGHSFQSILDQARFDIAIRYLRDSGLQVSQIAMLCGFSGAASFSRAFRLQFNMSPSQYRENKQ